MQDAQRYAGMPTAVRPETITGRLEQVIKILAEAESQAQAAMEKLTGSYMRLDLQQEKMAEQPTDSVASRLVDLSARVQRLATAIDNLNSSI